MSFQNCLSYSADSFLLGSNSERTGFMRTLYKNLTVYSENDSVKADILVDGELISRVGENITEEADLVYDCSGLSAFPALCDIHVHFRDPGLTYKEDIVSGCAAAAAGGFTAVACMPNTKPVCDSAETALYMTEKAAPTGVKVYPVCSVTKGMIGAELSDFDEYIKAGIKMISDDGRPVENAELMRKTLEMTNSNGMLVASHCEDLAIINSGIMHKGKVSEALGVKGMDRASEDSITAREIALADSCGARIHICHVSTKGSIEIIRDAKKRGIKVTCETAPHYFMFTEEKLLDRDADCRMNPPLREASDVLAVLEGVRDGTVDCIVTDHAPHSPEEKADFLTAPNGVVGLETSFAASYTALCKNGGLPVTKLVTLMSAAPRRLLGIDEAVIKEGARAEFMIADLNREWTVDPSEFASKSRNSVFKGETLTGKVVLTVSAGREIYKNPSVIKRSDSMSFDRLIEKIIETQNPTVVGLDPKLEYIPEFIKDKCVAKHGAGLKAAAAALYKFNKGIIDAVCDVVPAVKPQAAYYEMYGYHGVKALYKTIRYAQSKGMYVILDGKRNDIGATMEAYSSAYLGSTDVFGDRTAAFGADSLTVNGYLGTDGIAPALKTGGSIFVLVKTSNKSSGELQDRRLCDGKTIYETMGDMCEKWGADNIGSYGYSAVGAVVGATYPAMLAEMREKLPHTFFLVPGYGAQGGGAEGVAVGFDKNGLGAIVNSSRAVMCAYKKEGCDEREYAAAARREVLRMKEDITSHIPPIKAPESN